MIAGPFVRFIPLPGFALAACLAAGALGQGAVQRIWEKYPAVVGIAAAQEIFAVGDVHADYQRLAKLLAAGRIVERFPAVPDQAGWIAGTAIVVFMGDLI